MIPFILLLFTLQQPSTPPADDGVAREVRQFTGIMGVSATNLLTGEQINIDADRRFPTASTIKTAIMLEVYAQAADGRLTLDAPLALTKADKVGGSGVLNGLHDGLPLTIRDLLHLMIALSDNTATNMLVARVGTKNVDDRLASYGLHETRLFRPTFRDGRADVFPELEQEFGLGMTTPRDMARLMALIADGRAVNPEASAAMLQTLRQQQDRAMIPRLLPGNVQVGNKTGTDEEKHAAADGVKHHVRADAAIVTGKNVKYVIAIYARDVQDTRWSVENDAVTTAARISKLVYERFTRQPHP
jgi:beta-lactamase class A